MKFATAWVNLSIVFIALIVGACTRELPPRLGASIPNENLSPAELDKLFGASALTLSGPELVKTGACATGFFIRTLDRKGNLSELTQELEITINTEDNGSFYTDKDCKEAVTKVKIASGKNGSDPLYYMSQRSAQIQVSAATLLVKFDPAKFLLSINGAGVIDGAFGNAGRTVTSLGPGFDRIQAMIIAKDGAILVAGNTHNDPTVDIAIGRYTKNGMIDLAFGNGGSQSTDIQSGKDYARALIEQADGKIVVAGYTVNSGNADIALVRYNANGSIDTTFGTNGMVTTAIGTGDDIAHAIALTGDGKMLVAGSTQANNQTDFIITRYNTDGTVDNTFGTNGVTQTDFGNNANDEANALALQADGKILLGGYSNAGGTGADFAIARYNANGDIDTTFGTNGLVRSHINPSRNEAINKIAISNNQIYAAGYAFNGSDSDFAIAKYSLDGRLDTAFGTNGIVLSDIKQGNDEARDLVIQSDGKLIVGGNSYQGASSYHDFAVMRFDSTGKIDKTFGIDGTTLADFSSNHDYVSNIAIQEDSGILVAGSAFTDKQFDFALTRLLQ